MEDVKEILKNVWPEWEIVEKIGEGSFGSVYKAERKDIVGSSSAAIKITRIPQDCNEIEALHAEGLSHDQEQAYYEDIIRNYSAEIKLMMDVRGYTNIVAIDDYRVYQPPDRMVWYFVIRMELLTPLVKRTALGAMDEDEIIKLGIDLCTALDVCRRSSIIHRDIKPENIFFNSNGDYKLGDFGVARSLENHGSRLSQKGTYNYMAPEVAQNRVYDTRADIYSLGIVLYRLANGNRLPFLSEKQLLSPRERQYALEQRLGGAVLPPPANASPQLSRIIGRACSFRPEDRYASAAEMRRDLIALQQGGGSYRAAAGEQATLRGPAPAYGQNTARPQAPVRGQAPVRPQAPAPSRYAAPPQSAQAAAPKKDRTWLIVGLVAGAVSLLAVLAILLFVIGHKADRDSGKDDGSSDTVVIVSDEAAPAELSDQEQPAEREPVQSAPEPTPEPTPDPRQQLIDSTNQQVTACMLQGDYDAALSAIDAACVQLGDPTAFAELREQVLQAQYDAFCAEVRGYDASITLPSRETLVPASQRETRYVQGIYGQGIWLTRDGQSRLSLLEEGTEVTVYAVQDGRAFVRAVDGRYGWALLQRLVEHFDPELSHQRLVNYIINDSSYWTADGWREYIIANASDFPDYVVLAAIYG